MAGLNTPYGWQSLYYEIVNNYIYMYHTGHGFVLPNYPENIQDTSQASFQSSTPLGRSAPIFSYAGSGPRSVGFQFELHREMLNQVNGTPYDTATDLVDSLVKEIQSAVLPTYASSQKMVDPPLVAVRVGDDIYIKGVINGSVQVGYSGPILDGTDKYAIVQISFTVTEVDPYDAEIVRNIGSYRNSGDIVMNTNLSSATYASIGSKRNGMTGGMVMVRQ